MTSNRPFPSGHRLARAGFALLLLSAAAVGIAASACGGDDDDYTNFIGVTDAEPPRIGDTDGGARR